MSTWLLDYGVTKTLLLLRAYLELDQIHELLFLFLLHFLRALRSAVDNKSEVIWPPLVLFDLVNFVDLGLFEDFVLFKLILHMNEHHHDQMVVFDELHLLLEVLFAVKFCKVLERLLQEVVLIL